LRTALLCPIWHKRPCLFKRKPKAEDRQACTHCLNRITGLKDGLDLMSCPEIFHLCSTFDIKKENDEYRLTIDDF
jgi:hypothetical protein